MIIEDDNLKISKRLTKSDIDDMYKDQFDTETICDVCGEYKLCIDDRHRNIDNNAICIDCDTKRRNAENDLDKTLSVSNLALATMGV